MIASFLNYLTPDSRPYVGNTITLGPLLSLNDNQRNEQNELLTQIPPDIQKQSQQQTDDVHVENLLLEPDEILNDNLDPNEFLFQSST